MLNCFETSIVKSTQLIRILYKTLFRYFKVFTRSSLNWGWVKHFYFRKSARVLQEFGSIIKIIFANNFNSFVWILIEQRNKFKVIFFLLPTRFFWQLLSTRFIEVYCLNPTLPMSLEYFVRMMTRIIFKKVHYKDTMKDPLRFVLPFSHDSAVRFL